MVYVRAAREAYKDGIIDNMIWIRIKYNLADELTKAAFLPEFINSTEKNQLRNEVEQSVKISINQPSDKKEKAQE